MASSSPPRPDSPFRETNVSSSISANAVRGSSIVPGANLSSGNSSSKANDDDENSSQSSQKSPTLSPSQNHPMTNSIISVLDLGEEDRGIGGSERNLESVLTDQSDPFLAGSSNGNGISNGRAMPLAPRDVLGQTSPSFRSNFTDTHLNPTSRHAQEGSNFSRASNSVPPGADDSALVALLEAHQRQNSHFDSPLSRPAPDADQSWASSSPSPSNRRREEPVPRDASFGLDPDADTSHSIQGSPFRMAASSGNHHHSSHDRSAYDGEEVHGPSHSTAATGAPETMKTNTLHTQTVPTASATGMPRFLPRRTSHSGSEQSQPHSSHSSEAPAPKEIQSNYSPSGSLTIAIFAKGITWRRRGFLLLASVAINLGLPFLNGVMLGFGEIFARTIVAPWIGLAPGAININAPGPRAAATANTGGAGLRYAGVGESRGVGRGHVSVESWEVEPGKRGRGNNEL